MVRSSLNTSSIGTLVSRLEQLQTEVETAKADRADLQLLLDTVIEHSTELENQLFQKQQTLLNFIEQVNKVTAAAKDFETDIFEATSLDDIAVRDDELGCLARVFQSMAKEIKARERVFKQQILYEQLLKELEAARSIQASFLPHRLPLLPTHPQVDIHATMIPAKEVGGDFYDVFPIDAEKIGVVIGDVSGKGIAAALFMVRVMTLVRSSLANVRLPDPTLLGQIVELLNQQLCEGNEDCMFVTLFIGILDVTSGQFCCVNGGHTPPFIARHGEEFETLEISKGILVGVSEKATYTTTELRLQPQDVLVLYTDGVTEAEDATGQMFSVHRTVEALNDCDRSSSACNIVNALRDRVSEFADTMPQSDDLTLVALRYCGQELCRLA